MSLPFKHLAAIVALGLAALAGASAHAQPIGVAISAPLNGGGSVGFSFGSGPAYPASYAYPSYPYPAYGYARPAAPAPLYETIPYLAPGYVWNPGQWEWTSRGYRWIAGYSTQAAYYSAPVYETYYGPGPVYYAPAPSPSSLYFSIGDRGYNHGGYRHYHDGYRHDGYRHDGYRR